MNTGRIFNIQRFSLHDGPGIRTTVFLKGCPLDCLWCHNPEGISPAPELLVLDNRCIACGECIDACPRGLAAPGVSPDGAAGESCALCGACVEACPTGARQLVGSELTVSELMETVERDRIFYDDSGGGVTFSGGEPLAQFDFLRAALDACRGRAIHTAVDTCGLAPLERLLAIAPLADLFLFDLKLMDNEAHRRWTGAGNEPILANLAELARRHDAIWLRIPVIHGINDDPSNLAAAARLASSLPAIRKVCLLPYHRTAEGKLRRLGRSEPVRELAAPPAADLRSLVRLVEAEGVEAQIGG